MTRDQAYLVALGSNLGSFAGNPAQTLSAAFQQFSAHGLQLLRVSRYLATDAFPKGSGPDYVNAVASIAADVTPREVLDRLHAIENLFDRARENRWGARTLDLDLLAFGDTVLPSRAAQNHWRSLPMDQQTSRAPAELILPHPRLQDRGFVLVPLCDIDANWRHPVLGKTVLEMLRALPMEDQTAPRSI